MKNFFKIIAIVFIIVILLLFSKVGIENGISTSDLKNDLYELTKYTRSLGSSGEKSATLFLKDRFANMGYDVSLQTYTNLDGKSGSNVIAVRKVDDSNADILVISAHHDSVPTSYGANDDASGVVTLLAIADKLKNAPTDTELRFISFTDEENGKGGSRYYTNSLSEEERKRIIGDIQLDMIGGLGTSDLYVCTMDGESNWLSNLILKKDESLKMGSETASDHSSFQLAEIPSVLITQNDRGYLYHSIADTAEHIDLNRIENAVSIVLSAVKDVISSKTPSYIEIARNDANGYTYKQTKQNIIYFNNSLDSTEAYIGQSGKLIDQYVESGDWWTDTYEIYLYSMRWFNGPKPMNTYYIFRNDYLDRIEIKPEETGYTVEELEDLLRKMYGEPSNSYVNDDGVNCESWEDEVYSKYISVEFTTPCIVTINSYSLGVSNVLGSYTVTDGEATITDEKHSAVWTYLCGILPKEARMKIAKFNLFTDGYSNILAYTATMDNEDGSTDNTKFAINIDYYDVYDENGDKRDWSKLTYTILHEYGHVLLEDDTQIDLSKAEDIHDVNGFIDGSFRKNFYNQFWKNIEDTITNDYEENPTNYVTQYAANYFHEDIADTFAIFVLSDKPQGSTVAEDKVRFFWDYENMTILRSKIRKNLGLE